jgi:cell filamentation protein
MSPRDHSQPQQGLTDRMYDAIEDPYTYKNSTVLVNKLDLQNQADLDAFEAEISGARAEEPLPDGWMDFEHYKAIHHHLFQDVYHRAGQVRTVRIAKGGNPFCFPENVEGQATRLFDSLYGLSTQDRGTQS